MSRVDAVRIAVEKAREHGHALEGAVLASDAFFPFADGPEVALDAGVDAIIQPGGSKRDDEVAAVRRRAPRWSSRAGGTSGTELGGTRPLPRMRRSVPALRGESRSVRCRGDSSSHGRSSLQADPLPCAKDVRLLLPSRGR